MESPSPSARPDLRDESSSADTGQGTALRPQKPRAPWLYRGLLRLGRWVFAKLFVIEVRGREHIPQGSCLLVSNHLNWIDPFIMIAAFPDEPRLHFVGNQEAMFNRWWKRLILGAVGGVIPVSHGSRRSHEELLARAVAVLQQGGAVGIFPEGRVGPEEGKLLPFMNGLGHLSIRAGVPVLPAVLAGTSELYRGRRITVTFGEAFVPDDDAGALKQRAEATVRRAREALEAMLAPYQEPPGVVKRWGWLTRLM